MTSFRRLSDFSQLLIGLLPSAVQQHSSSIVAAVSLAAVVVVMSQSLKFSHVGLSRARNNSFFSRIYGIRRNEVACVLTRSRMHTQISCRLYFWNSLPDNVTSANLLSAFRQQLKHTLFQQSFPDIIMWHFLTVTPIVAYSSGIATKATLTNYWLIDWLIDLCDDTVASSSSSLISPSNRRRSLLVRLILRRCSTVGQMRRTNFRLSSLLLLSPIHLSIWTAQHCIRVCLLLTPCNVYRHSFTPQTHATHNFFYLSVQACVVEHFGGSIP